MGKKYIFFDMDGTLMNIHGAVEDSTRDSLIKLKERGHEIYLATGRSYFDIPNCIQEFRFDGLVLNDGAYVEYNKEVLVHKTIDKSQLDGIAASIEADKGHLMYLSKEAGFINEHSINAYEAWLGSLLTDSPMWIESQGKIKPVECLSRISDKKIGKVLYIDYEGDLEKLKEDHGHYFSILPSNLSDLSDTSKGEITQLGITKAYGIEKLLNHIKVSKEDVIAFGDGLNDVEMIELAGVGVAMGNGAPSLKESADLVTTAIGDNGIYNGLKQIKLV
jgi:Cof subfamily protein (haloacid dehalogenase superfamily)